MRQADVKSRFPSRLARGPWLVAVAMIAGCAMPLPSPTETLYIGRQDARPEGGFPSPGTVWRLDADELKALGPIVPAPDPPPAPRPESDPDYNARYLFVPSFVYYGPRFGMGWDYAPFWPHYRYAPFPPYYYYRGHPRRP